MDELCERSISRWASYFLDSNARTSALLMPEPWAERDTLTPPWEAEVFYQVELVEILALLNSGSVILAVP